MYFLDMGVKGLIDLSLTEFARDCNWGDIGLRSSPHSKTSGCYSPSTALVLGQWDYVLWYKYTSWTSGQNMKLAQFSSYTFAAPTLLKILQRKQRSRLCEIVKGIGGFADAHEDVKRENMERAVKQVGCGLSFHRNRAPYSGMARGWVFTDKYRSSWIVCCFAPALFPLTLPSPSIMMGSASVLQWYLVWVVPRVGRRVVMHTSILDCVLGHSHSNKQDRESYAESVTLF